jgi:rubredoxin
MSISANISSVSYGGYKTRFFPARPIITDISLQNIRRAMKYRCATCGNIYDEEERGVPFADLPDDWTCPICGEPKSEYYPWEE